FFFQAEDGIRDGHVTGVQTCALPILFVEVILGRSTHDEQVLLDDPANERIGIEELGGMADGSRTGLYFRFLDVLRQFTVLIKDRSEERRVGKECRSWWSAYYIIK